MRAKLQALFIKATESDSIDQLFDLMTNYIGDEPDGSSQLEVNPEALAKIKKLS